VTGVVLLAGIACYTLVLGRIEQLPPPGGAPVGASTVGRPTGET